MVQEAISIQEDACECLTSFWVAISRTEVLLALEARVAAKMPYNRQGRSSTSVEMSGRPDFT